MGTAHFFEHLVFKGSAKMSQHELSEYAEATGTLLNAYTSREHTSYYFQGRRDNTEKLVEILADVIQKPDLSRYSYDCSKLNLTYELYIIPVFFLINFPFSWTLSVFGDQNSSRITYW